MATSEEEYEPQYPTDSDEVYVLEHYDDQPQSSLSLSSSSLPQLFDNVDGVEEEDEPEPQLGQDYDQDDDNEMLLEGFGDSDDLVFGYNYDINLLHDDNEYYITSFKDSPEEILHDIDAPYHDGDDDDDDDDDDDEKDISFGDNKETSFGCGRQRIKIDDEGHDDDDDDDVGDVKDELKRALSKKRKIYAVRDFPSGCGRPITKTSDDDDDVDDDDVDVHVDDDDDDDGDGDGDEKDVTRQENKQGLYKRRKITVVRDFPFGCGRPVINKNDSVTAILKKSTEEEGEGRRIVLALAAPSICPWRDTNGGLKKGRSRVYYLN